MRERSRPRLSLAGVVVRPPLTDSPIYWRQLRENAMVRLVQATHELDGAQAAVELQDMLESRFPVEAAGLKPF